MLARQWLGDLSLAVLLVLPLATLAKAQPTTHHSANVQSVALSAERTPTGRISLLG